MNELVSVIIPTFNREKTIIRAVESVLNQTYCNVEVIIVDDCSTDNTVNILHNKYDADGRVIIEQLKKNSGACVARNRGIEISRGSFISFLDSDDAFYPFKIERQMEALSNSLCDVCATDYDRIDQDGHKSKIAVKKLTGNELYEELLFCNFITTGTLLGKRNCFEITKFDESLPRYQDWDLVLRLCKKYDFCLLNESTILQEFQQNSITSSTSHKKTYNSMCIIYQKNKEGFNNCKRANTQFKWLMGLHSMYIEKSKHYDYLWSGVIGNGFNFKRFIIYVAARVHMYSVIDKLFSQG